MPAIKAASIQAVRERVRIEEVIGAHVVLRRAGTQLKGLCPFHQEKTPSFHVSPDKGFFKCFGCGRAGDAIRFVMDVEHREFVEAVEVLARQAGVALEYEEGGGPPVDRSLREETLAVLAAAADWFRAQFVAETEGGRFARAYWEGRRRFPLSLAEEFQIGWAPAEADALVQALGRAGRFRPEALRGSGLFFERRETGRLGGCRFRGRLMIPIRDVQDRVVAFTARQTERTPPDDPAHEAKYVNSPETDLFHKGSLLFNLARARGHVSDGQPFLLVEGQLDALRCWQVGLRRAVAPQGTAVTETQLALLRRYSPRLDCFLDGDRAGQAAAGRLLPMALRAGLEIRFLPLPAGEDPDSLLRAGGLEAYERLAAQPVRAMEFAVRQALPDAARASSEERSRAVAEVLAVVAGVESEVLRQEYLREVAARLGLTPGSLADDFRRVVHGRGAVRRGGAGGAAGRTEEAEPVPPRPEASVERDLLSLIVHYPDLGPLLAVAVPPDWLDLGTPAGRLLDRILADMQHGLWEGFAQISEPEFVVVLADLALQPVRSDAPDILANAALAALVRRAIEPRLSELAARLAHCDPADRSAIEALVGERKHLLAKASKPPTVSYPSPYVPPRQAEA